LRAIESKILKKAVVKVSLEDLFDKIKEGEIKELNIISKQMSKVGGSFTESLLRLSTDEVRVNPTTASWRD
jgi:translation initiation factor IF-2